MKILLVVLALAVIAVSCLIVMQTVAPERAGLISNNFFELRDQFRSAASARGATLTTFPIKARKAGDPELSFDVAWLGNPHPEKVFLHISGTHGVEGYAGSAIQTENLKRPIEVPENSAVVFVHGLNPWGMAYVRRFNESNVDLNRNFLLTSDAFRGAPEGYRLIESFLNPPGAPSRLDLFYPEAAYNVLRHGFNALKQAIAGGQYEYPRGIYYGGNKLEESLELFRQFVTERFSNVEQLFVVEIHTGLGEWAKDVLFWQYQPTHEKSKWFSSVTGETLASDDPNEGVGFKTPGDLQNEVQKLLPKTDVYWILQEFGAYGPVKTLRALRDENRYHQSGGEDNNHWSKGELLEAFTPGAEDWQRTVVARGQEVFGKVLKAMQLGAPHLQAGK